MKTHRQLAIFGVIGVVSAIVHLNTVATLVPLGIKPLLANVGGFLVAVGISFVGHSVLTFPARHRSPLPALRRFLFVAVTSFACNELLYYLLLSYTTVDYRVSLGMVLLAVAALTFMASKYWVFTDE